MAYGKNSTRKDWLLRATPIGVGVISKDKLRQFLDLRELMLDLMRNMSTSCFVQEPLAGIIGSKEIDTSLLVIQKDCQTLSSVWKERSRMLVKPALEECNKRYFQKLAGSLIFVDSKIPVNENQKPKEELNPAEPARLYFNIPADVQSVVTKEEIKELQTIAQAKQATALFQRVILNADHSGLSETQVKIIHFIYIRAQEDHKPPSFGLQDDFVLQLHIDSRMLASNQLHRAQEVMDDVSFLLEDDGNKRYIRFLDVSSATAHGKRIRVPLVLTKKIAKQMRSANPSWASLVIEISKTDIGVRLVNGKQSPVIAPAKNEIFCVVGRDFGYTNTISLSVARSEISLNTKSMERDIEKLTTGKLVKEYLESHVLPSSIEIIERVRFSGKAFIKRAQDFCQKIDGYKSKIDLMYNQLEILKQKVVAEFLLEEGDLITADHKKTSKDARAFFALFGSISDAKKARRALYRKIAQLKKNWFGFLSNIEVQLAKKHNALFAREDLTVEAIEKDSLQYKGRAFNKLLNNGSKGQYQNRASDKFKWNGIPEILIPSWYTSRTCLKHSTILEKKYRQGERIHLTCCGTRDHADEHAADTIASYLFVSKAIAPLGDFSQH